MKILKILYCLEILQVASAIFIGAVSFRLKEQCCKEAGLTREELELNTMQDKTLNQNNTKCAIYVKCLLKTGNLLQEKSVDIVNMKHYLILFLSMELKLQKKTDPQTITDSALSTCAIYKNNPLRMYNCINLVVLKYLPYKPYLE